MRRRVAGAFWLACWVPRQGRDGEHWMRAAPRRQLCLWWWAEVGVYIAVCSRGQPRKVIVMPLRAPSSGGFGGAGAIRTPETLPGPKIGDQGTNGTREQEGPPAKKLLPEESRQRRSLRQVRPRRSRRFRGRTLLVLHDRPNQHSQQRQYDCAPEGRNPVRLRGIRAQKRRR